MEITDELKRTVYESRDLPYFVEKVLNIQLDIKQKIKLLRLATTRQDVELEFENKEEQDFLLSIYLFHYMIYNQYKVIEFCSEKINKELIQKIQELSKKVNKDNFCKLTYLKRFCKKSFEVNYSQLFVSNLDETVCMGRNINLAFIENNKKNKKLLEGVLPVLASSSQSKWFIISLKN